MIISFSYYIQLKVIHDIFALLRVTLSFKRHYTAFGWMLIFIESY